MMISVLTVSFFFFFNDTATTEIYTLSLHDALPISLQAPDGRGARRSGARREGPPHERGARGDRGAGAEVPGDRKSTRLNSSHLVISYAVFCLKKKKKNTHLPAYGFSSTYALRLEVS